MMIDLNSIKTGTVLRAPRIILLGESKIGKSSFACGAKFEDGRLVDVGVNNPIVIPIIGEEGTDDLGVPVFPSCRTLEEVYQAIGALCQEHEYRTAVIDSASALEPLIWDYTCKENGGADSIEKVNKGFGKGYIEALKYWRQLTQGLDALRDRGMASIIIGHVKVKRFDDPAGDSYDQYQFDINDKAANLLFRWADVILFANTKVAVKKEDLGFNQQKARGIDTTGGMRYLFTQKRPAHPGGGRGVYGRLPYELPLDWGKFQETIASLT